MAAVMNHLRYIAFIVTTAAALVGADPHYAKSPYDLCEKYYWGEGVLKNHREAATFCRLAADQGLAPAQSRLGIMYAEGEGVVQNDKEALRWFRLSADQGDSTSQYNLGFAYSWGRGVVKGHREAVKWYRLAAEQGHADAQLKISLTQQVASQREVFDAEPLQSTRAKLNHSGDSSA
jgi:uncharacterized protein